MVRRAFRHSHNFALLLLLFVSVVEVLPSLHHHEEEHACAQLDGSFFYLDSPSGDIGHTQSRQTPVLRGVRLGDHHSHLDCPLCQLLTTGILPGGGLGFHGIHNGSSYLSVILPVYGSITDLDRSRGPPAPPA